jgi:membrane protease YdiL (CAAX protease family)
VSAERRRPPKRGLIDRWVIALVIAFVFIPAAVYVLVPILWASALVWYLTVPLALVALVLILRPWRWLQRPP